MNVHSRLYCELLEEGYLHSFEDLFNIGRKYGDLVDTKLIAGMLRVAERGLNRAEYEDSFLKFKDLGQYFVDLKLHEQAAHFFEKCKTIAESKSKKTRLLREAYLHLGLTYEALERFDDSIENHKLHIQCREKEGQEMQILAAHDRLYKVYRKKGNHLKRAGKYQEAMESLHLAVESAREGANLLGEGEVNLEMGEIHDAEGRDEDAISCYRKYLKIGLELKNTDAESKAYHALGTSYRKQKNNVLAHKYLEAFLEKAKEGGNVADICTAERSVGEILFDLSEFQNAADHYEKNYDSAIELKKAEGVNRARVDLGMIHGQLEFEAMSLED